VAEGDISGWMVDFETSAVVFFFLVEGVMHIQNLYFAFLKLKATLGFRWHTNRLGYLAQC